MSSPWLPLPGVPPLLTRTPPLLFEADRELDIRTELESAGARLSTIDLGVVTTDFDFFAQLRTVLVFPDWCGSGWDPIEDAFEEIRASSSFPCFVVAHGLQHLLRRELHLGLEIVIRLSELQAAFALAGDQFVVVYQVE